MDKVSIIMPLFNAERYLTEALQSVLRQTYKEFELICVNDGSTDNTEYIITDFQSKDDRIKIITNKERLGAGPSRNKGLKEAKGEYVIFLDGDDVFEEELLEKTCIAMKRHRADIVLFEALHVSSEMIYIKKIINRSESFIRNYCESVFSVNDFELIEFPNRSNAPWNKLFLKSFLEANQLEFQDLPSSNDVYFANMALICAKRIICLDDGRVMVYVRDHFEPSRISNDRDPMCAYYAMEKLAVELSNRNMFGRFADFYYGVLAFDMLYLLRKEKDEARKKSFYCFLRNEGIAKCIQYGKETYNEVDSYYQYVLESIRNNIYESETSTAQDTYFQYYLKKNGQAVLTFINEKLKKGRKIVLWGIGINGQVFLDYLDEHIIRIFAAVDMDIEKQGSIISGYRILKPGDILQVADVIITTSKQTLWEIKDRIGCSRIEQVNLLELLKRRCEEAIYNSAQ